MISRRRPADEGINDSWICWTWKTEQAADWSMQTGITYGGSVRSGAIETESAVRMDTDTDHC